MEKPTPHKKESHEAVEGRHKLLEEPIAHLCGESPTSELELSDESDTNLHSAMAFLKGQEKDGLDHDGKGQSLNPLLLGVSHHPARVIISKLSRLYIGAVLAGFRGKAWSVGCGLWTDNWEEQQESCGGTGGVWKVEAMANMLESCDLIEQLVLRNTGLTDNMLNSLVTALKSSPSDVVLINLNLNDIGPAGVQSLLNLLRLKPQIKGLLLFGNHLGDTGVCTLLSGLAELQGEMVGQTTLQSGIGATQRVDIPILPEETSGKATPLQTHITQAFVLLELDLGGNGIGSEGLRVLSSYLRCNSQLKYLGLAQTKGADIAAWANLFESFKTDAALTHIILDECRLGDEGVELFAKMLRDNQSLTKVELDYNSIGERGGNAIIEVLLSKKEHVLSHLSLEGNHISVALMNKIQQELRLKLSSN
ncbi:hypothetical protein AAFF_G00425480 [Aldrovandia affinis]|uniref:Uncharacterized protein n=1 Tax=Aldrovandia affinis TaxID=143900 RepID=A0AAD7T7G1_9TELE|nr:hypothetical protein AAFF_G00425480 [Aldrovandia affinis]